MTATTKLAVSGLAMLSGTARPAPLRRLSGGISLPTRSVCRESGPTRRRDRSLAAAAAGAAAASKHGQGAVVRPYMSVLPKVAGQSLFGDGRGTDPPTSLDSRQASIAGQSAAFRTSVHTAAP